MKEVVLVYQPYVPATLEAARGLASYLDSSNNSHDLVSAHELGSCSNAGVRLAVCFGGDGTALRAARWLSSCGVPVLPIRMGKLSFLGELWPHELPGGLDPYLAGDFWLDERAMLTVAHAGSRWSALNDVVLARGRSPRAVSIELLVDGASVATYLADGMIVSTATGSTAYSLAAGGPVLAPHLRCLVATPVVPHLTSLRSIVLPETARVSLVNRGYAPSVLTVDGQLDLSVEPGQIVDVALSTETALFARRGERSAFYGGLAAKLARG